MVIPETVGVIDQTLAPVPLVATKAVDGRPTKWVVVTPEPAEITIALATTIVIDL